MSLPSREYVKADGAKSWVRIIDFKSKSAYAAFQQAARTAMERYLKEYPEASRRGGGRR